MVHNHNTTSLPVPSPAPTPTTTVHHSPPATTTTAETTTTTWNIISTTTVTGGPPPRPMVAPSLTFKTQVRMRLKPESPAGNSAPLRRYVSIDFFFLQSTTAPFSTPQTRRHVFLWFFNISMFTLIVGLLSLRVLQLVKAQTGVFFFFFFFRL